MLNTVLVQAYWNVGKYIVEFEQQGNAKAKYGTSLLTKLSKVLTLKLGTGYSRPNLNNMRKFNGNNTNTGRKPVSTKN